MRRRSLLAATAVAIPGLARAQAGPWPSRPIRLVVPFPPGGTTDVVARLVSARMGAALGQPIVVENRGGAGGTLGSDTVAKAAPDGYAFVVSNIASHGVGPSVYPRIQYDALRDFTHVAMLAEIPSVLAVNIARPVATLAEFLDWARRDPGGVRVATAGNGSSAHVKQELLKLRAGVELVHLPYRGSGPALNDLVANQVEAMVTTLQEAGRNERLRLLAVTTAERVPGWPDLPTFREQGFPELVASTWFGISGPAGLPDAVAERMNAEAVAALAAPDIARRLAEIGSSASRMTRADYAAFVARDLARWGDVVRAANVKVD